MDHLYPYPKMGHSWLEILEDPLTRKILGHDATMAEKVPYVSGVHSRFKFLLQDPLKHISFAKIGYTALEAFLQASCTGPPLDFDSIPVIIPETYREEVPKLKQEMLRSLSIDGIDVYPLTPRIELFWLAKCMLNSETMAEEGFNGRRARFRINFWHQKLLPEHSDSLRSTLYDDAEILDGLLSARLVYGGAAAQEHMVEFLVERAQARIYYGDYELAREDLLRAAKLRDFEFALTGSLGRRTKFQQKDVSQLVVLAKSRDAEPEPYHSRKSSRAEQGSRKSSTAERSSRNTSLRPMTPGSVSSDVGQIFSSMTGALSPEVGSSQPDNIPLNDDTLLENIQFSQRPIERTDPTTEIITEKSHLPAELTFMDPADQPQLFPMDSIILLSIASSITNTQASDGLTREETLPYATRVLDGGSSNWSVYSEALLIRSRIEGYQSRTAERGLLQLQALVDQVIAETSGAEVRSRTDGEADSIEGLTSSFLPKPTKEEGASVAERLRFVHQLHPPFRWELETELAARWTAMGGLKTALEIYERLQLHAETALCLAATDRESEAVSLLKKLLFVLPDQETQDGDSIMLNKPLPSEAPRLLCILGDIQQQPKYYNAAWTVSNSRYARAQRSLGKFYLKKRDFESAVAAYTLAVRISRQDLETWFSLGCVYLELNDYQSAVEAFTKVVQLEDKDAQGWSNLAVALLRLPPPVPSPRTEKADSAGLETITEATTADEEGEAAEPEIDPLLHTREALRALRRAAQLKRDDARIWDNYLTVAASIPPDSKHPERSTPWQEVLQALSQVITLRQKKEGEGCVDVKILEALIDHVTSTWDYPTTEEQQENGESNTKLEEAGDTSADGKTKTDGTPENDPHHAPLPTRLPFLPRALLALIDTQLTTLASSSAPLLLLLSRVSLWRHRPAESLSLIEKSWRATLNNLLAKTTDLVGATGTLVNAYRTVGPMERERTGGKVEGSWRFKSRTAVRSVLGKIKEMDADQAQIQELEDLMGSLKVEVKE